MRWRVAVAPLALIGVTLLSPPVYAADPDNRGLLVTPIREYKKIDSGKSIQDTLTVANLTKNAADVTLSVEQFSVTNFSYDYTFELPREKWITIATPKVRLEPGESKQVKYNMLAPKKSEPGGHYFTILASTSFRSGEEIRAATMLYITVNGKLTKTSDIVDDSLPFIAFGGDIPFEFDVHSSGNVHFFTYTSGRLEGLSAQGEKNDAAHIILPQTTRTIEGHFAPPLLPGVYKAVYGYKTDGGASVTHEKYLIYAPLWSWALLGGSVWFLIVWSKRRKRSRSASRIY